MPALTEIPKRHAATVRSTANWLHKAARSSSAVAWRGLTPTARKTTTGPRVNQQLPGRLKSRDGRVRCRVILIVADNAIPASTSSGTRTTGATNNNGTNPSWTGTVNPSGVSKRTAVANASTSTHGSTDVNEKRSGGYRAQRPATTTKKPTTKNTSVTSSRLAIRACARERFSAMKRSSWTVVLAITRLSALASRGLNETAERRRSATTLVQLTGG